MDAGLRARTKQFIEFGLKISFTPCAMQCNAVQCNTVQYSAMQKSNTSKYIVSNSRIRTIMQCNAEINETQHSCGEVQQITRKGIIQLTILRL